MKNTDYVINFGSDEEPILAVVEKYMTDSGGISDAEFQKAKRLLNGFQHVLWTIISNIKELDDECKATMNEELAYAVEVLDKFDYRMYIGKLVANQKTRLMAKLIVTAILKVKEYPSLGEYYLKFYRKRILRKIRAKKQIFYINWIFQEVHVFVN